MSDARTAIGQFIKDEFVIDGSDIDETTNLLKRRSSILLASSHSWRSSRIDSV